MPREIKSAKQFRFLQAAAHGGLKNSTVGPSPEVAKKMLSHEDEARKKRFARAKH